MTIYKFGIAFSADKGILQHVDEEILIGLNPSIFISFESPHRWRASSKFLEKAVLYQQTISRG